MNEFNHGIGEMSPFFVRELARLLPEGNPVIWEPFSGATSQRLDSIDSRLKIVHSSIDDYGTWCFPHDIRLSNFGNRIFDGAILHPPYWGSKCGKHFDGMGYEVVRDVYIGQLSVAIHNVCLSVKLGGYVVIVCRDYRLNGNLVKFRELCMNASEAILALDLVGQISGPPDTGYIYKVK